MTGFSRAQAEYEGMLPDSDPAFTGTIEIYLLDGPHAEKLALLEYDESTLIGASNAATKEEIDIEEIAAIDINRGLDALIENQAYYGK